MMTQEATETTEKECLNELCDFGELSPAWKFCPSCGRPAEEQEDPPLILKSSIAYLALYKLDPYVFKLFMFIYFETAGSGKEWKRLKQEELEKECKISHPKVLNSLNELKADNGNQEDVEEILHWITQESRTERWSKRQGYGLHEDMNDSERLSELLKPFLEKRRKRNRSYY